MEAIIDAVLSSDGTELLVRRWTPADPERDLIIVHGFGEHCGRWDHVAQFLAERGYAVTSFDLRGHGDSQGRRAHVGSFDEFIADTAAVVGLSVADRPWVLYGHSMGGLIALRYLMSDHPQPDAAVITSPWLDDNTPQALRAIGQVVGGVLSTVSLPAGLEAEQLCRDPTVGEEYFADPLVETKITTGLAKEVFRAQDAARASIDELHVPTLVLHGTEDTIVPPEASAPLAASDAVDRKLYPGLRHEMHNEPEWNQVLSDVTTWLDATLS